MRKLTIKQAVEALRKGLPLGNGYELRLTDPTKFAVDHSYQRDPVVSSYTRIAGDDFDEPSLGLFQAGERVKTKKLMLTDGQTRNEALNIRREHGLSCPDEVLCMVRLNTTRKDEADMFVHHNSNKPVQGNAKFKANLEREKEPEVTIRKWVEAEGFYLEFRNPGRRSKGLSNGICSVSTLLRAHNHHQNRLQNALRLLRLACGSQKPRQKKQQALGVPSELRNGQVVLGLCIFLKNQGGNMADIAETIRKRAIDLVAIWENVKATTGAGWERYDNFADQLTDQLGDGAKSFYKKAA